MIYVISDLHGFPFGKFRELLQSAGFSDADQLYVLGDVVDRGADGVEYLLWLKEQSNAELILGNHEATMRKCDFLFAPNALELMKKLDNEQRVSLSIWMSNGAEETVRGLFSRGAEERGELLGYLSGLALYREISAGERRFLLVHSGLRDFAPQKTLDDYSETDMIWNRPVLTDRYFDDRLTVFGHTPTFFYGEEHKGKIITTDTWLDIDVGVGYGNPPVLLRLDDMKQFGLSVR